jgi:hypothetical protein
MTKQLIKKRKTMNVKTYIRENSERTYGNRNDM